MNNEQRLLNRTENQILNFLLSTDFPGRLTIIEQLKAAEVKVIDTEGSLEFFINDGPKAKVLRRIPIEAQVKDSDGVYIHILLHVVNGCLKELEIYKEDGSSLNQEIDSKKLELIQL